MLKFMLAACCTSTLSAPVRAEPRPSPTPVTWELTFKPADLQRITVKTSDTGVPKTYWYMLYKIVNNTGQDIDFLPQIERVSEIDSEVPAEFAEDMPDLASRMIVDPAIVGLHPAIFRAIKERHAKTHRFLVEPVRAIGRILQGLDNARESVVVFDDLDPRVSRFTIYVGGLSGERQTLSNPLSTTDPRPSGGDSVARVMAEQPVVFVLQKTLAMPYTLPGDDQTRRQATPVLGRLDWVMR
jgi:hypothetical protein